MRTRRFMYRLQIPMILFLPAWIGFGRAFFGAIGWLGLITVFLVAPVLFLWLLILAILNFTRHEVRGARELPRTDTRLLGTVYVAGLALGFFFVDGGDTGDSIESAFSMLAGHHLQVLSEVIAVISGVICFVALIFASVHTVVFLVRGRNQQNEGAAHLQK